MSDTLNGVFTNDAVVIRLASAAATALGISGDVPLYAVSLKDGWLLAEYRETSGELTKYLLPATSVLYVRQVRVTSSPPPPQGG